MNHLTNEQFADWLAEDANPETQAHLESCAQCRVEARQLRDGISRYALAIRRQSAEAQGVHMAATIAPGGLWRCTVCAGPEPECWRSCLRAKPCG